MTRHGTNGGDGTHSRRPIMTFQEKLARLNENPKYNFHVFAEYAGGVHDYFQSFGTLERAEKFASKLTAALVYDREGNDVAFFP